MNPVRLEIIARKQNTITVFTSKTALYETQLSITEIHKETCANHAIIKANTVISIYNASQYNNTFNLVLG